MAGNLAHGIRNRLGGSTNFVPLLSEIPQEGLRRISKIKEATDTLVLTITSQGHTAGALTVADSNISVDTAANASTALGNINTALDTVKTSIANLGSFQSRLIC